MNTKQIIDEMEKEFDETIGTEIGTQEWAYFTDQKKVIKSFIHSYTRKLIESLAEEIIGEERPLPTYRFEKDAPYDVHTAVDLFIEAERETSRELLKDEQRLKVKEILSNLK